MRGATSILAALLVVAVAAGCGGSSAGAGTATVAQSRPKGPLREVVVTLDGYAGPENVGILMARWKKYFEQVGLEVKIYSPSEPVRPVRYTAEEVVDVGISREPEVVLAQGRGTPVVAIGSLISEPTAAMIWLGKSDFGGIADLKGKTIGFAGLPMQKKLLGSVLKGAGLQLSDVKLVNQRYKLVSKLAEGKVDAIFGAGWNLDGVQLEKMGLDPVITRVQDLGVPPYDEYVVIVRRDRLAKEAGLFGDFMAALGRGTAAAIADPDLALEVIDEDFESDYAISPKVRRAQVDATVPLLAESAEIDPARAESLVDWMYGEGMIDRRIPVSSLLTNELLPEP
jgi:putative hydroxymethylpyrimidine transport system substrate-binding protein